MTRRNLHGAVAGARWIKVSGGTRAYVCVDERDTDAIARAESQGFRLHHRRRFFRLQPAAG